MVRKKALLLVVCFLGSFLIVTALYLISESLTHRYNGFIRLFPPTPIHYLNTVKLPIGSYYFAGATSQFVFLSSSQHPLQLIKINQSLTKIETIEFKLDSGIVLRSAHMYVDSPFVYLMDGIGAVILKGTLDSFYLRPISQEKAYFVHAVALSPSSFILHSLRSQTNQYTFIKEKIPSPQLQFFDHIIPPQKDGIFTNNGILLYDPETKMLGYVYTYRNQYLVLDINLNIVRKAKTIDTISEPKIKVTYLPKESSYTLSTPPFEINKNASMNGSFLYIQSALKSKNERTDLFDSSSVVDVYDSRSGTYKFSFYLFNHGPLKLRSFLVFHQWVYALYDQRLIQYKLDSSLFHLK